MPPRFVGRDFVKPGLGLFRPAKAGAEAPASARRSVVDGQERETGSGTEDRTTANLEPIDFVVSIGLVLVVAEEGADTAGVVAVEDVAVDPMFLRMGRIGSEDGLALAIGGCSAAHIDVGVV